MHAPPINVGFASARQLVVRLLLMIGLLLPISAEAVTRTWLGLTSDWNTTTNWSGSTIPTASDVAMFNATGFTGSFAVTLATNRSVQQVFAINSSASTWTFTGSTINAFGGTAIISGQELTVFNSTGGAKSILNSNLNLSGTAGNSFSVAAGNSGGSLTINGLITGVNRGVVFQNIAGEFIALNGASTYTGNTVIRLGTVIVNTNALSGVAGAFGNATTAIGLSTGLSTGSYSALLQNLNLYIGTSGVTIGRDFDVTNVNSAASVGTTVGSNITSGTATYSGNFALARDMNVAAATGGTTVFSGVLSGTGGLVKKNSIQLLTTDLVNGGTVSLTGINTYTGATTIDIGTLNLNTTGGNAISAGAGAITVNVSGTLSLSQSNQIGDNVNLVVNSGTVSLGANSDTVNNVTMTAGSITGSGSITSGTGSFTTNASGSTATISAGIGMSTATTFTVVDGAAATDLNATGVISGANDLVKAGAGLMAVSGSSTYTGTTTVRNGTLRLDASAPLSANGVLGNAASAVQLADASSSASDKIALVVSAGGLTVGRDITVNSNNSSGTTTIGGTHTSGTSTFSGAIALNKSVVLTAATGGTDTFSGVISGTGGITKTGSGGTVILSNTNTFVGSNTVRAGFLRLNATGALGSSSNAVTLSDSGSSSSEQIELMIGAGGVSVAQNITVNNNNSIGSTTIGGSHTSGTGTFSGNITLNRNVSILAAAGGTDVFSGVISGTGNISTGGGGTVSFTGINTYTGTTQVSEGTLTLNTTGGNAISAGAGNITVVSGGILSLAQANQIGDNVNLILSGGTLRITGNETLGTLSLTANSTIDFSGSSGVLTFSGIGSFTAGRTLTILNWNGSGLGGGSEQLVFNSIVGLTPTVMSQIYFQYNNNPDWGVARNIIGAGPGEVVPTPEVGTIMSGMLMLCLGGYAEYRRRKGR